MTLRGRNLWNRRSILLTAAVCGIGVGVLFAVRAIRQSRADLAFASVIRDVNGPMVWDSGREASSRAPIPPASLVVLVRDIRDSLHARPAYHVRLGLDWPVLFANRASKATRVLLVDRIHVDVRSYRPIGEDYQIVLHGTLLEWPTQRVLRDFVVRGPRPADRVGWLTLAGPFNRTGDEPWSAARSVIAAMLAGS